MINLAKFVRAQHRLYCHHIPILPKLIQLWIFIVYSSAISPKVRIGGGTFFNHSGFGILLNENVIIGRDCKIGNSVSIVGQGPYKNAPVLRNRVYVGPGAVIQGPVVVENNVIVAPNAVVTKSCPKNAIVAGNPAKIIGWSNELNYDIFKDENWDESIKPYLKDEKGISRSDK